jgi:DNA-binding NarL/FixJ family response regulator
MQKRTISIADETPADPGRPEQGQPHKPLSPRMREVLTLVAGGQTHDQAAVTLGISPSAVRRYIATAKSRLGVKTRNEAIVVAVAHGMVQMER